MKSLLSGAIAALALLAGPATAQTTSYPTGPVTIVVPFAAGGAVDLGARNLADGLSKIWGQPVVVENKPGGGTLVGTLDVAQGPKDGSRLLFISSSFTASPAIKSDLPYDPVKDFIPVLQAGDGLGIISAGPRVKANTIEELIAETRERSVFFTTSGNGSFGHLSSEAVSDIIGVQMKPVHYKAGSESILDVAGGRADLYIGSVSSAKPFIDSGTIKILATMGRDRNPTFPDSPTLQELGYKDAYISSWWGLFAPAGVPEDVIAKINADGLEGMQTPKSKEFLAASVAEFYPMTSAEFTTFVHRELGKWREVAQKRGIASE